MEAEHPLLSDERVTNLLGDCVRSSYYDRFVEDMLPVLVGKLTSAGGEPLKRAKEELGAMGDRSAEALRRLVEESFADAARGPYIENAIDALALNDSDTAHDVLAHLLTHPMSSVRQRAALGMISRHAAPQDFDDFVYRAEGNEPIELRRLYVRAMFMADRDRAEDQAIAWLRTNEYPEYKLDVALEIAHSKRESTGRACADLLEGMHSISALPIAGPALRVGDPRAIALVEAELESEHANLRLRAVRALAAGGMFDELRAPLEGDPDTTVRVFAVEGILSNPDVTPEQLGWIANAMTGDESPVVRARALAALCLLADPAALDQALAGLTGATGEIQPSLLALKPAMDLDPELARRAFETLRERYELESLRPIAQRTTSLKCLGVVPLADAVRLMRDVARSEPDATIEGLRAHDWLMIQASNSGQSGLEQLALELETETDPVWRLDLITALAASSGKDNRDWIRTTLLELIDDGWASEYERLYIAERLVKVGPSAIVAPRLKQICPEFADPSLQVALQCLLWRWY